MYFAKKNAPLCAFFCIIEKKIVILQRNNVG